MSNKNVLAIILAGGMGTRLKGLTDLIAKPAIHFGGKYRIIDFTLSNCTNSGLDTIGVITQYEPIELTSYIGRGGAWDLDVYDGGITVLPPYTSKQQGFSWQKGTAHAVIQHINFIELYNPEYILILSGDHIYKMDYSELIDEHKKNQADLTIACLEVTKSDAKRFGIVEIDQQNKIITFEEKPDKPISSIASQGIYCFTWRVLKDILLNFNHDKSEEVDFGKHIIPHMIKNNHVYGYRFNGYWKDIGTIESLWKANMELIDYPEQLNLRDKLWPIFTNATHMPPHHTFSKSLIRNSIVCEGSLIFGNVYHSVVSGSVLIGENSTLHNCVVMPNVKIGQNCFIKNAIIKMNVMIPDETIIDNDDEVTLITEETIKKMNEVKQ